MEKHHALARMWLTDLANRATAERAKREPMPVPELPTDPDEGEVMGEHWHGKYEDGFGDGR